ADPRRHRAADHRHARSRPHDRSGAERGSVLHDVRAHPRDGPARRPHQFRRPTAGAPPPVLAPLRARGRARMKKFLISLGYVFGLPIILVLLWWLGTIISPSFFVPTPGELVTTFIETWFSPRLWVDVLPSVIRFAIGTLLAIAVGVVLGLLVGLNRDLRAYTEPVFEFFRALPPPVLIPILALVMGRGDHMQISVILLGAIWPVVLNTIEGVRAADSVQTETSRSYGITGWNRVRFQVIPSAMPQMMAGIRQSLPIAIILMVIGEM